MQTPDPTTSNDSSAIKCKLPPLQQALAWLVEGQTETDIKAALVAMYPDDDPQELLLKAMDHFQTVARADHEVIRGWCLESFRELYRRMVAIGDYAGALRAVKELLAFTK